MDVDGKAAAAASGLSSPISVVGFACASSELHSPRSSTSQSSAGRDHHQGARSSVSLLSLLLTTGHSSSAAARARGSGSTAEDTYDDEDAFDEDEDEDGEERSSYPESKADDGHPLTRTHGSADHLQQRAAAEPLLRRSTTAPMEVPTAIWLREPLAKNELRRMQYERCVRRAQLEALQQQQALAYQQQMRETHAAALQH